MNLSTGCTSRGMAQKQSGKAKRITGTACQQQLQLPPLPCQIAREQEEELAMATMTMPFEAVEQNVTFVFSGVNIAERMHDVRKVVSKVMLTPAFHDVVARGRELIESLDNSCVKSLSSDDLIEVADKLDKLVLSTNKLIDTTQRANFVMWNGYVRKIVEQRDKFDSLAESFRLSSSEEFTDYVDGLVASAAIGATATEGSWRDFVATLHD